MIVFELTIAIFLVVILLKCYKYLVKMNVPKINENSNLFYEKERWKSMYIIENHRYMELVKQIDRKAIDVDLS